MPIYAYALSDAVVASITAWGFLQFPGLLIWCAFNGWAGFLHSGGDLKVLPSTICGLVFGAFMAWPVALIVVSQSIPLKLPLAAAVVAVFTPVMILASSISLLKVTPLRSTALRRLPGANTWKVLDGDHYLSQL
ncbi:DUF1097 domain-containing protein [Trinickia mobilis]|uniref:DUF1097 domain-containing protein n=1 Tax=Trinickia mobilis TaxID=2816356 RepID=UPI001A8D2F0A|nr:DUF1097 domain-containing protein [Trinickia mobilis]